MGSWYVSSLVCILVLSVVWSALIVLSQLSSAKAASTSSACGSKTFLFSFTMLSTQGQQANDSNYCLTLIHFHCEKGKIRTACDVHNLLDRDQYLEHGDNVKPDTPFCTLIFL